MPQESEASGERMGATRRTVLKASGAAAGAGLLGAGFSGSAAAEHLFQTRFANPRTQEAARVWERGYRGRRDRTAGINDSGIEVDHPDLGDWNGVTAVGKEVDGSDSTPELLLTDPDSLTARSDERKQVGQPQSATAVLGPGTTVEGSQTVVTTFTVPEDKGIVDMDATLSWTPSNVPLPGVVPILSSAGEDQSFSAQLNVGTEDDPEWITLKRIDTGSNPEELTNIVVVPGEQHRFVAGQFANVASQGTVEWEYYTYENDPVSSGGNVSFDAKTVGWFDAGARYGQHDEPADPDGHGSHVSGIVAGTGQASTIDNDSLTYDDPRAVLTAGDALTYEVEAHAGTGVFGVATGEGIEVLIEGPDGRELRSSGTAALVGGDKEALPIDDARVDHPTTHEHDDAGGKATYTVVVRAAGGEAASTGQVEEVTVGAFANPEAEETVGAAGGEPALNTGMAPNAGLVGLQGLSGPTAALGLYGEDMGEKFNMRTVNISWGGLVPGGGTVGGGGIQRAIKKAAQAGILSVAAAGNNFGTINTAPAIADEAVSVAATNYVDGVTAYTDGGAQAQDEDGGTYGKPDVCAPGGSYEAGARSVRAAAESDKGYVRDYVNFPGTSMASPYTCGAATLLAQAMEEDAPDSISLPVPTDTGMDDVMRLKQVLLGTASKVAFTAAPYHRHATRYVHDGRSTYQGYGRINPDAAVDAVTRSLLDTGDLAPGKSTKVTSTGTVGLDVPRDPRAVAGYVEAPSDGTLDVSLEFSHYSGGNKGMAKGSPHVDLFVYDAENPAAHGEPNTVVSAQATQGSASVSADVGSGVYYVVAKLVNVPGVVNGFDVQANLDITTEFTRDSLPALSAGGSRQSDATVFTGGGTKEVKIELSSLSDGAKGGEVTDTVPDNWTVIQKYGDVEEVDGNTVHLSGTIDASDVSGDSTETFTYFVEAPSGPTATGEYTFGPAEITIDNPDEAGVATDSDTFGGEEANRVVGASTQV